MNDRDNTIECLKYLRDRAVIAGSTITEKSDWIVRLCDEVLEMLEEQKPRLLTLEEVKTYPTNKALWFEGKTFIPVLPDCRAEQRYEDQLGVEVIDTFYDFPLWFDTYNLDYKFGWRCWSAKPTDEQREAVKWQE